MIYYVNEIYKYIDIDVYMCSGDFLPQMIGRSILTQARDEFNWDYECERKIIHSTKET